MNSKKMHNKTAPSPTTVAVASFIGTTIEWFDFFVFGAATVLILNPLFFPSTDQNASVLAGFGAIAVAFIARPLGGLFFGHYGDKIGRKRMLVLSVLLMGIGTFAVGLLPTYAQVGVWAPILLVILRFLQGFAVGGEWGGAVLMSLEHAPPHRRAFYASFPQAGVPAGVVLSTGSIMLITQIFSQEELLAWAWRLPFITSILLVALGLYIRLRVTESPEFLASSSCDAPPQVPAIEIFKNHKKSLVIGMLASWPPNIMIYLTTTFFLNYATNDLSIDRSTVLIALTTASLVEVIILPLFPIFADRWTTRRFLIISSLVVAAGSFLVMLLINTATVAGVFAAYLLALPILHAISYGTVSSFTAELFPAEVRYTGASIAYQLGGVITSAPVPIIATLLLSYTGTSLSIALYATVACIITAIAISISPRTRSPMPSSSATTPLANSMNS